MSLLFHVKHEKELIMDKLIEILKSGAEKLGVSLDSEALKRFETFTQELLEWNKVMNLTAITNPEDIAVKHYIDSLAIFKYVDFPQSAAFADVGCGAGFPGIPMKIARPDLKLTCMDSLGKRVKFLAQLMEKLKFDADCVHIRAEDAGMKPPHREAYDFATARAVAQLRVLAEYCLPLVKVGGAFIAMKGGDAKEEISQAKSAVKLLGGEIENVFEYNLPDTDMERTIIVIRKTKKTPGKFPRSNAKIAKSPL